MEVSDQLHVTPALPPRVRTPGTHWIRADKIEEQFVNETLCGSGYGPVADSCEHGNEPSGPIKGGELN